jgi:hypothetical protein
MKVQVLEMPKGRLGIRAAYQGARLTHPKQKGIEPMSVSGADRGDVDYVRCSECGQFRGHGRVPGSLMVMLARAGTAVGRYKGAHGGRAR